MKQPTKLKPVSRWMIAACVAGLLAAPVRAQAPAAAPAAPPPPSGKDLDIKVINAAIAKAVTALYKLEPTYTFPPEYYYTHGYSQETVHAMGNHALAIWALLAAGESYQNPPLYRRINWVLSGDQTYTYDRGMRATMLNHLPRNRWGPWVHRDGVWLSQAVTDEGNFGPEWQGSVIKGPGDNANGQYGVLGLWAIDKSGYPIENKTWDKIDRYWRAAQDKKSGGWGVYSLAKPPATGQLDFYSRTSGPMTAGAVGALCLTERFLRGPTLLDAKKDNVSPELRKGIEWLDSNFSLDAKDEAADWFFYMWTIQRVGGATGYRTFNGVDWFRDVTARILSQQQADGTWAGDKGTMLSTGFAVLYLSKANDPLAIAKVRFKDNKGTEGTWQNRPHDIWNFADYASDEYECDTTWQIAELTQPPYELLESPVLYLATNESFSLGEKELANLRYYIDAGGLLVLNAEDSKQEAIKAFRELAAKLYPGKEFKKLPTGNAKEPAHPFYDIHQKVKIGADIQAIDNGLRPLIVMFPRDIGRDLQANERGGGSDGFRALSNIYLYVTGLNPRRSRLESNYTVQRVDRPRQAISAARIKYSGRYDPEPMATPQLKALLANIPQGGGVDLQIEEITPDQLKEQKIAFLTTMGEGQLSDAEAASIRRWVEAGGTLWLDAAGGSDAARQASAEMLKKISPNTLPAPLVPDDNIISAKGLNGGESCARVKYRFFALSRMGPVHQPRLQAVEVGGRKAIIYSTEDLTCGLAGLDHWSIFGYTPQSARQLVINGVLAAMRNPTPGAPGAGAPAAVEAPAAPAAPPAPAAAAQ